MRAKVTRKARFADVEVEIVVSYPADSSLSATLTDDFVKVRVGLFARETKAFVAELANKHAGCQKGEGKRDV